MNARVPMVGHRFGRLLILSETTPHVRRDGSTKRRFLCACDCGQFCRVIGDNLRSGHTQSCGCWHDESARRNARHGHTVGYAKSPEYKTWDAMLCRCYLPSQENFERYGGAGVRVCDRWREDFANFLADMGPKPTPQHSIDRWPDPAGNYEPGNCRWATPGEQRANRRHRDVGT